jgi:hypothetical protein
VGGVNDAIWMIVVFPDEIMHVPEVRVVTPPQLESMESMGEFQ